MARWLLVALAAIIALVVALPATAQDSTTNVELRVWQRISNPLSIYVSARPEDGSWNTLGTIPLALDQRNSRGTFRYGDIDLEVPLQADLTTTVQLRVWQRITNPLSIYVSARHKDGSWNTLGTIPLALDQRNSRGTFRYGDITLAVPVPSGEPSQPLAETQNLRWLKHTHWDLYRQITTLPWVSDGVTETETTAVDNLLYLGASDIDNLRSALGLRWVRDAITETESDILLDLVYLTQESAHDAASLIAMPWFRDSITEVEHDGVSWLNWLRLQDDTSASTVIAMPWFEDGITETEAKTINWLAFLNGTLENGNESRNWSISLSQGRAATATVMAKPWFQDDITEAERDVVRWLASLTRYDEKATATIITMPFLAFVEPDDVLALRSLHRLAYSGDGRFDAVMTHPNVRDGITDDETTLVAATGAIRGASEVRHILVRGNARTELVFEKTRHTPNLKISIIRTGTQPRQTTLDDIMDSVEFVEGIMNRPLPVSHIIVVVGDYAVTEGYAGTNYGFAFSVLSDDEQHETPADTFRFRSKIIHETAHFFWRGHASWIDEGVANTFEYLYGVDAGVSPGQRETPYRGRCEAHDLEMLTEWDPALGQQGRYGCSYFLGQSLFHELLAELGRTAFSQRLQELYRLSLDTKDDPKAETPGIAEVRQAFPDQAAIVEKHWSGKLNAPENRPIDDGARGHHLVQWDQRPVYDGEFVTFRGTLLGDAVLFNETVAEAQENGRNFRLHAIDDNRYVGSILPPLPFYQSWKLDDVGDVVAIQYDLGGGTFSVRFRFPQALGDPSDYMVYVRGFQDESRTSFFGWTSDVLGGARIQVE